MCLGSTYLAGWRALLCAAYVHQLRQSKWQLYVPNMESELPCCSDTPMSCLRSFPDQLCFKLVPGLVPLKGNPVFGRCLADVLHWVRVDQAHIWTLTSCRSFEYTTTDAKLHFAAP